VCTQSSFAILQGPLISLIPKNCEENWLILLKLFFVHNHSGSLSVNLFLCIVISKRYLLKKRKTNNEFIRWFHKFSVTTNLCIFHEIEFVYLLLCTVNINKNIRFQRKKNHRFLLGETIGWICYLVSLNSISKTKFLIVNSI
jgi:hypothetical protein